MAQKITFAARWPDDELKAIKHRAKQAGFDSVSEYVKRCALGTVDQDRSDLEKRFAELEERIARCEAGLF